MENNYVEQIRNINHELADLYEKIHDLEAEKNKILDNNRAHYILRSSYGNGDYWDEYYAVVRSKHFENEIASIEFDDDWDQGMAFYRGFGEEPKPYFQVTEKEFYEWQRAAFMNEFKTALFCVEYRFKKEQLDLIFNGNYNGITNNLSEAIKEQYAKIGLGYPSFQHVSFYDGES